MQYAFTIGQAVRAKSRFPDRIGAGIYQIIQLLPAAEDEMPCYRVRSVLHGVEWDVAQDRIEASAGAVLPVGDQ